jgi:hypothetical protein
MRLATRALARDRRADGPFEVPDAPRGVDAGRDCLPGLPRRAEAESAAR